MTGRSRWNKLGLGAASTGLLFSIGLYIDAERWLRAVAGKSAVLDVLFAANQRAAAKLFAAVSIVALLLLWRLGRPVSR